MYPPRPDWFPLYREALLELDLQKMPARIVLARIALEESWQQLPPLRSYREERVEIGLARQNLHAAERMK